MSDMDDMDVDALKTLDSFPYRHRVSEVMATPLISVSADLALPAAATRLEHEKVSSLMVLDDDGAPQGIVTERDLLRAFARGRAVQTVGDIMTSPVLTVRADAYLYVALGRMARSGKRHLAVVDTAGRAVGMVTGRAMLKLRAGEGLALGDEVAEARTPEQMAAARARLPALAAQLRTEGVSARDVAAVISAVYRDMTRRAAILAVRSMGEDGLGDAPAPWALLVLGSGGRGESLLKPDQDNAIVHGGTVDDDAWFAEAAKRISDMLDAAGVPYCRGNVMATNPAWRRSLDGWRDEIGRWVQSQDPEALLAVDIFFDFRAVYGDGDLAEDLRAIATNAAKGARSFLTQMGARLDGYDPPLNFFGRFKTQDGRLDLKWYGLLPVVSGVRVMALQNGIDATSTKARIAALARAGALNDVDAQALDDAHALLMELVLVQQLEDQGKGRDLCCQVEPARLKMRRARALKTTLSTLKGLSVLMHDSLSR